MTDPQPKHGDIVMGLVDRGIRIGESWSVYDAVLHDWIGDWSRVADAKAVAAKLKAEKILPGSVQYPEGGESNG